MRFIPKASLWEDLVAPGRHLARNPALHRGDIENSSGSSRKGLDRGGHLGRFSDGFWGGVRRAVLPLVVRRIALSDLGSATSYFVRSGVATLKKLV